MSVRGTRTYKTEDFHILDVDGGTWTTLAEKQYRDSGPRFPKVFRRVRSSGDEDYQWSRLDPVHVFRQRAGVRAVLAAWDRGRGGYWALDGEGAVWFLPPSPVLLSEDAPERPGQVTAAKRAQAELGPDDISTRHCKIVGGESVLWFAVGHEAKASWHRPYRREPKPDYVLVFKPAEDRAVAARLGPGKPESGNQRIRHFEEAVALNDAIYYTAWREETDSYWLVRQKPESPGKEEDIVDLEWAPKAALDCGPRLGAVAGKIVMFTPVDAGVERLGVVDPDTGALAWHKFPDRRAAGRGLKSVVKAPARGVVFLVTLPVWRELGKAFSR